ncbi:5449_t:CDS:2 [Paraglomus brasilianum]|uniref:5449_t:CDS:1 n=1 Tax=Paraglomus brasilianum TaxID=144538 RepID=A0A9N8VCA1_9GLOM|nr:5449_t:CDS:2 [Paraglomus brasilianum]
MRQQNLQPSRAVDTSHLALNGWRTVVQAQGTSEPPAPFHSTLARSTQMASSDPGGREERRDNDFVFFPTRVMEMTGMIYPGEGGDCDEFYKNLHIYMYGERKGHKGSGYLSPFQPSAAGSTFRPSTLST